MWFNQCNYPKGIQPFYPNHYWVINIHVFFAISEQKVYPYLKKKMYFEIYNIRQYPSFKSILYK